MKRRRKYNSFIIKTIVVLTVTFILIVALAVINIFVPIIYVNAYFHINKDINPNGQLRVSYLDVGYGDCTVIELPDGKNMLIDGGVGSYGNVYSVLDALNLYGIDKIDYLICTSVKSEHCGALAEVVKYKEVKRAYIPYVSNIYISDEYAAFYNNLLKSGAETVISEFGDGVYNDEYGYFFMVLSPSVRNAQRSEYNDMNQSPTDENIDDASAVVWLEYSGRAFMFLSDVSASVQSEIADMIFMQEGKFSVDGKTVELSSCTVVKASNHCASGYTSAVLYDLLSPEAAVISVGENALLCPNNLEIANLQLYVGENIFRTDICGTVKVKVSAQDYSISKEKE